MSRRRNKLPVEPVVTEIESLSHEGRGVAHINGKTVFIDGALPGERVSFRYRRSRAKYAEGIIEEVLGNPSPDRIEPACKHFLVCGGCSLQHLDSRQQVSHKEAVLDEQLRHIGGVENWQHLPALEGPDRGYRRKARLGVKYVAKKEKVLVGFREKFSSFVADISVCEVLHPAVGKHIDELAVLVGELSIYNRVAQIELAIDEENCALIFRNLAPLSSDDVMKLHRFGETHHMQIHLQPGGPGSIQALAGDAYPDLCYRVDDGNISIYFSPWDFTQVNMEINQLMVKRVLELLEPGENDRVLDLFCGVGNFSLPIARRAASVTGIEGATELVERARSNASANGLANTTFIGADLNQPLEGQQYRDFNKLLLDPPRSGAQAVVEDWDLNAVSRLLYVSCNPATLARDTAILVSKRGFRLVSAGVMNMFPHTTHVESIALFEHE